MLYRRGDRGAAVAEIRDRLIRLGQLRPPTGDFFDGDVYNAVREFQQQRGLVVDGIVGPDTFARLEEARWSLGDRVLTHRPGRLTCGDDVSELQERVARLGFDPGRVDGMFGSVTEAAVRDLQRGFGLTVDGVCGPSTLLALRRLARSVSGDTGPERLRDLSRLDSLATGVTDKVIALDVGAPTLAVSQPSDQLLALDIAGRVEGRLAALGVQVVPPGDPSTDPGMRASRVNLVSPDLLVSFGVGSAVSPRVNGIATFYYGHQQSRSVLGLRAAELVHDHVTALTDLTDCRVHPKTWDLLRLTSMPTVYLEIGYSSAELDRRRLDRSEFRDVVAEAVAVGIVEFFAPVTVSV